MSKAELLALLQAGSMIRYVPKSIIYNRVIGVNSRELCIDGRIITDRTTSLNLNELLRQGLARCFEERSSGILWYKLKEQTT